tara:strand:+ start:587 stop:790 length:204 start_codon:yes stop_codon:yes gene_type:complete
MKYKYKLKYKYSVYKIPLKYLNGIPIIEPRRDSLMATRCKPPPKPTNNEDANTSSEQERDPTFPFLL